MNNMDSSLLLNNMIKDSYQTALDKGWHEPDNEKTFLESAMLIITELSEAVDEFRNGRAYNEVYYNDDKPDKPEGIPIEMADVLIRLFDTCAQFGIDLESAYKIKSKYNLSRPYRHGNKVI